MNPLFSPFAPIAAASFLLFSVVSAEAADLPKELSTAITHAGMAAGAADLKMVQTHLHHVVNCLVGPNGAGFDAGAGNPCKDQGAGAIPDSTPDKQKILQTALASAQSGIGDTDIAMAKAKATEAQATIKKAE